jgi:uncharacterized membrane protein YhaH (DUF805 family)
MMFEALRHYAQFTGRARRAEYWMFALFNWLMSWGIYILLVMLGATGERASSPPPAALGALLAYGLFVLAMLIPSLAVAVRRLHDINRSGWWLLIVLLPGLGALVLFIFLILEGTRGPNRFGPDPKAGEAPESGPLLD